MELVQRKLTTMTAGELIKALSAFAADAPVTVLYPSHDYWGTMLAGNVKSVDYHFVKWSEYHYGFKIVEDIGKGEPEDAVLVLT